MITRASHSLEPSPLDYTTFATILLTIIAFVSFPTHTLPDLPLIRTWIARVCCSERLLQLPQQQAFVVRPMEALYCHPTSQCENRSVKETGTLDNCTRT